MRAAVYDRFGGPDVVRVEERPTPSVGPDEVLVRVVASTVSAADHRARTREVPRGLGLLAAVGIGAFRPKHRVLGMDAAGVVEAVGADVTRFAPGDEVIGWLGKRFGGHAGYAVFGQDDALARKPRTMSLEDAVTLVFGGLTAHGFLQQADLRPGARVLVNGASGAVGTAAVQLAAAAGAQVTGVCSGANAELVMSLGAKRVVDYATADFTTEDRLRRDRRLCRQRAVRAGRAPARAGRRAAAGHHRPPRAPAGAVAQPPVGEARQRRRRHARGRGPRAPGGPRRGGALPGSP
jgi:NADPH:quinone reductase-like Zn-dependent oxidoreductase